MLQALRRGLANDETTSSTLEGPGSDRVRNMSSAQKKRCRVQLNDADERQLHKPFTDAPYLHPFNQPRYHALIVRSQLFARANNRILLWYIAIDKPYQGVDESLRGDALQRRREKWLEYSDDKTAGMMGLLPLVRGMPMRCTACLLYTSPSPRDS